MNDYPSNVKAKLNFIISDMANHHCLFANRRLNVSLQTKRRILCGVNLMFIVI